MEDTTSRIKLGRKEIILIGTAHVSKESVDEVKEIIEKENPDRVCVEIDESRYKSMMQKSSWSNLNITKILRQGKGFLLLANLVLASFQRRLGLDIGVKPGEDMIAAITASKKMGIPFSFCDREIQITLKRAWSKTGFWGKNKMIAAMLTASFTNEKLSKEDIEKLKKKSALHNMMEELSGFLPSVKKVLIDERDIFLAAGIYNAQGKRIVAVVGAGHVPGIIKRLKVLHEHKGADTSSDISSLNTIPKKGYISKAIPYVLPVAIIGSIIAGFILRGSDVTFNNIIKWILFNGVLAAIGSTIALAHPLTILLSFLAAPITSLIPVIGVGIVTGIMEAALKKPRVSDFESLHDDLISLKRLYKNRFTHVLIVFMLSNLGSSIGTFLGGIPLFASLFGG